MDPSQPAPHILSNPPKQWVAETSAHAVFSIHARPRGEKFPEDKVAQQEYVYLLDREAAKGKKKRVLNSRWQKKWESLDKYRSTATGFVFQKPKRHFIIRTAAHTIGEAYDGKCHLTNVDLPRINRAYFFSVCCVHRGRESEISSEENDDHYVPAAVVAIDSSLDLMALIITEEELALTCNEFHCTISGIAGLMPKTSEQVLLQGWPMKKFDTAVWGCMSAVRSYKCLTCDNPVGYKMQLSEIPELDCEDGCSGGPLVNGRLECVGLYHATLDYCGYAVHIEDIRRFLIYSGLEPEDSKDKHGNTSTGEHDNGEEHDTGRGVGNIDGRKKRSRNGKLAVQKDEGDERLYTDKYEDGEEEDEGEEERARRKISKLEE